MSKPIVIVGGGPAGSAAACLLARAGNAPLLIEREAEPRHKICGEFLSVEAQHILAGLGIDPLRLGGEPINRLRLVHGRSIAEANLPFRAVGLTRRALDAALLGRAATFGAQIIRGQTVRSISHVDGRWRLDAGALGALAADALLLATGKHDVRSVKRNPVGTVDDLIGFKCYFRLAASQQAALADHIEVMLFADGYAGLQLVEGDLANLCLLVRRQRFEQVGKRWEGLLDWLCTTTPHLGERLTSAEAQLERPLTIAGLPYGFVHRPQVHDAPGLFRTGDQAAVIPSFSGDGVSIALYSGQKAAEQYLNGGPAASARYQRQLRRHLARQVDFASMLYRIGCTHAGRSLLVGAARAMPRLIGLATNMTRISEPGLWSSSLVPATSRLQPPSREPEVV